MNPNDPTDPGFFGNLLQNFNLQNSSSSSQNPRPNFPYMYPPYANQPPPYFYNQYSNWSQNPYPASQNSPVVNLDSEFDAQTPIFSTQKEVNVDEEEEEEEVQEVEEIEVSNMKRQARWSDNEDMILTSAWLNTSKNSVIGNSQTGNTFWNRIAESYNENRDHYPERVWKHIKDRWSRIHPVLNKFSGCHQRCVNRRKSGSSDNDVMADALRLYKSENGKDFKFIHLWNCVKHEIKWRTDYDESMSKRHKVTASGAYTTSSNADTNDESVNNNDTPPPLRRPMGQKASKELKRGKGKKAASLAGGEPTDSRWDRVDEIAKSQAALAEIEKEKLAKWEEIERTKIAQRDIELKNAQYEILMRSTDDMTPEQRRRHEKICAQIEKELFP